MLLNRQQVLRVVQRPQPLVVQERLLPEELVEAQVDSQPAKIRTVLPTVNKGCRGRNSFHRSL